MADLLKGVGVLDLWRQGTLEKRMSKVEREPVYQSSGNLNRASSRAQ